MIVLVGRVTVILKAYSNGLNTHLCGEPVLSRGEIRASFYDLWKFIKKSFIWEQVDKESPKSDNLLTSMHGIVKLKIAL